MILILAIFVSIFHVGQPHAGFDCYCNLNHPEAFIFNCPNGQGFPIAALRTPRQVIQYQRVNLQMPFCIPKLVNIQPQGSWVPVYSNGNLGYLNVDVDFKVAKCTGMLTFNPNTLVMSPICHHIITNVPGLSVTGPQNNQGQTGHIPNNGQGNQGQTTHITTTTAAPWHKIPQASTTSAPWHIIPHYLRTTTQSQWHIIPHKLPGWHQVGGNTGTTARCYGPDVDNDVQKKQTIFYHLSRYCPMNGAAADEVTAAKYCSAPEPKLWRPGKQVNVNCKSLVKYTPVSVFKGGKSTGDGTAIFLTCTQKGTIQVVRQTCKSKMLELVEITATVDLFVVEW